MEIPSTLPKKLLDRVRDAIRLKHYSYRTEQTYVQWIRRFILFHNKRHPQEMGIPEIEAFLTHLALTEEVEIILIVSEQEKKSGSIIDRRAFLRLPIADRGRILEQQAETALAHYQKDSEWQEWVDFDIAEIHDDQP
jgi:Phage integrase, N-terminal SAM-like domain